MMKISQLNVTVWYVIIIIIIMIIQVKQHENNENKRPVKEKRMTSKVAKIELIVSKKNFITRFFLI